jgi:hypothetical protein
MKSFSIVTSNRKSARAILDAGLHSLTFGNVDVWSDMDNLAKLEVAVAEMKKEAGRLRGIAKIYRATIRE